MRRAETVSELYVALERLGADAALLAIVGGWRDRLTDVRKCSCRYRYNGSGKASRRPQ